jgi:CRP/FNR family transcriptional regulator
MESGIETSYMESGERSDRLFYDLPIETLKAFDALKATNEYQRGTVLFREGSPCKGVLVLCEGRARLSVCSESGSRLTLRIAGPGEILGLSACLAGTPHEMTAELLDSTRVALVRRKDLMEFLHDHREACMKVVTALSQDLHRAYDRVRSVGMGRSRRSRPMRVH